MEEMELFIFINLPPKHRRIECIQMLDYELYSMGLKIENNERKILV